MGVRTIERGTFPRVVNIRDLPSGWRDDPQFVYIGCANKTLRLPESKWHNPEHMRNRTQAERSRVIRCYTEYLRSNEKLLSQLDELAGKTLVCWCSPEMCHGHILAAFFRKRCAAMK